MNNPNLPTDPRSQMSAGEYEAEYHSNHRPGYEDKDLNSSQPERELEFSGAVDETPPWYDDWLSFANSEYNRRVRRIMLNHGMSGGDVEMILANVWEDGWIAGRL